MTNPIDIFFILSYSLFCECEDDVMNQKYASLTMVPQAQVDQFIIIFSNAHVLFKHHVVFAKNSNTTLLAYTQNDVVG